VLELSVAARFGDSGGPILNSRGELAGVLFGANWTSTMGSYCGRVRVFLASAYSDFQRLPGGQSLIAQGAAPSELAPVTAIAALPPTSIAGHSSVVPPPHGCSAVDAAGPQAAQVSLAAQPAAVSPPALNPAATEPAQQKPSRSEQLKTILAAIGIISILFHSIRLIGAAV
jgi:hypothetical protein